MAKKDEKKKDALAIRRLTPNAIAVVIDGEEIFVPSNRFENAIRNQLLSAQMRDIMQNQIKKYKDSEATMSPKELADLAKAARDIASFSTEVYAVNEGIEPPREKVAEKVDDDLDFSKESKPAEEKKDEQP